MSLFEDTNPRELKEMLGQIHNRDTALPDFQRDFVWDPNATQELIVSIANNYPAGSLLRIRNTHNLFAAREFQGAPPLDGHRTTYLVLDGQQRLTSLYQAFYGVGEHRYFVDLRKLLDGADFEEAIFHLRSNVRRAKRLEEPDVQAEELILPLSVLKGGAGGFGRWSRKVARRRKEERERIKLEDSLSEIEEDWVRIIDDYRFPVVTLSDSTNAEAVCTIFETLNRTGVKLSPFELLTARFWPKEVNLRDLWSKALEDFPIIETFDVDPYYALQAVALLSPRTATCKRSDVLNLEPSDINDWWDSAVWGFAQGLEMLRGECGVLVPRWLPYSNIIIPLAATLGKLGLSGTPEVGANKERLTQWFWCSVLAQTYDNAQNSQAAKDYAELVAWLQDGADEPETISTFRFDPRILRDTTYRQRALYRGLFCLVLRGGPRDFYSSDKLTPELILEHEVEDHHIFPYAYLGRKNVPVRLRDCALNRTLIDRDTNRRISDKAPSVYMEQIRGTYDEKGLKESAFDRLVESHHMPSGKDSPLLNDDFEAFLDYRQEALWKEIRKVTGVRRAAQIVEEEELSA